MIAAAGAIGALSRYGVSTYLSSVFAESGFPFGTLAVNIVGCLIIGIVMHIGLNSDAIPANWRIAVCVGFLGALTTFSSFSYETVILLERTQYLLAAANIIANVAVGIPATFAGLTIGKIIIGG